MTVWDDFESEMQRLPLDADTADRLLAGDVLREDAPPGYQEVVSLLSGLRTDERGALVREPEAVARLLAAQRSSLLETIPSPRRSNMRRSTFVGVAVAAALACTTGLALAGSLPGAAQAIASSVLGKVGVTVPGPDDNAGSHPSVRGRSSSDTSAPPSAASHTSTHSREGQADASSQGKGAKISELATQTELTGVDKGAAISTLASGGKSQAGQHGQASSDHGSSGEPGSSPGAETADAASGGHSSAGADNAAAAKSHRP
jgi:hypothetical protein